MTVYALPYFVLQWLRQAAIDARRRNQRGHYVAWSVAAGVATGGMLTIAVAFVTTLWWVGLWWLALPMLGLLALPPIADVLARRVLVPAGFHRLAYHAARVSRPGADPTAYALCVAAAAAQGGRAIAWVEAARDARTPLGDAEVAATGLLAAGRGDADTARTLLGSLPMLVENHPAVRELAGEWLACDAAARGAWDELPGEVATWPATPLRFLLEGIAAQRTGAPGAPGARELWARWLVAPRKPTTRALIQEALAATETAAPGDAGAGQGGADPSTSSSTSSSTASSTASPTASATASSTALPRAVSAHLAFDAASATASELAETVRAWDVALGDPDTRRWIAQRALELDAPAGAVDRALAEVATAVADELARAAESAELGAPPDVGGPVGTGVARRLRHGRLDALEAGFSRWAERRHTGTEIEAIDEWREFIALWSAYRAAVSAGGSELRRLAFPHAFSKGNHMAAWLWNQRSEYVLSHAISAWLLDEALAVGDTEAIEYGHRNCSLTVPTRLGQIQP